MIRIELCRLPEVDPADLIALMTHPLVRRHMPLTRDGFDQSACAAFVADKEAIWAERGFGPCGIVVDGAFAGWGGLQPEAGDVELALVLHPDHWGVGRRVTGLLLERAFGALGLESVTALIPPSRTRLSALRRLGFERDGEVEVDGEHFLRFRLHAPGPGPR